MAGFYKAYLEGKRFVILTTRENSSVQPVHERMPLVLEKDEITDWLLDTGRTEAFLHKQPYQLVRRTEFEQLTLFN